MLVCQGLRFESHYFDALVNLDLLFEISNYVSSMCKELL